MENDNQDGHAEQQMALIVNELNNLQTSYDTRLLSALLAGRAAMLLNLLVNAGHMKTEDANVVWDKAGEIIDQPQEKEIKTLTMYDGHKFDASKVN